jgi:plastocyanin
MALPAAATQPPRATVIARSRQFVPAQVLVPEGAVVRFENQDSEMHTVTAVGGAFDLPLPPGQTRDIAFPTPGTVAYYCRIHGTATTGMHGIVLVQAIDAERDTSTTNATTTPTTTTRSLGSASRPSSTPTLVVAILVVLATVAAADGFRRRRRRSRQAVDQSAHESRGGPNRHR